jgi:CpXC protein
MSVSLATEIERKCSACGHRFTEVVWMAIDLDERPDLRAAIVDRTLAGVSCSQCGNEEERPEPLLLLRAWQAAPLVQVSSAATLQKDDPFEDGKATADEVVQRLGSGTRDIPGPMLLAPWVCAELALRRDLDADAVDPKRALQEVRGEYGGDAAQVWASWSTGTVKTRRWLAVANRQLPPTRHRVNHSGSAAPSAL